MNIPVEVKFIGGKVHKVMDDELAVLISDGWVPVKNAAEALQKAGLKLDKNAYAWLRSIVDPKTRQINPELAKPRKLPEPELVTEEAVKALPDAEPEEGA